MRLVVAAVGRLKQGAERELAERFRERAEKSAGALGFRGVSIVEIEESRRAAPRMHGGGGGSAWRRRLPRTARSWRWTNVAIDFKRGAGGANQSDGATVGGRR